MQRLRAAVSERASPYRTPALCTCGPDGAPRLRTMVLRGFDAAAPSLTFHTDRRSRKLVHVVAQPRVSAMVWDAAGQRQVILSGTASAHLDDPLADSHWGALSPAARRPYECSDVPGTLIGAPPSLPGAETDGRDNFAVLVVALGAVECLHLRPDGNLRARFTFPAAPGPGMEAAWLTP